MLTSGKTWKFLGYGMMQFRTVLSETATRSSGGGIAKRILKIFPVIEGSEAARISTEVRGENPSGRGSAGGEGAGATWALSLGHGHQPIL